MRIVHERQVLRYRLKCATWYVVREQGQDSPRVLGDPEAAALLAIDLSKAVDDDKEHVWAILVNSHNRYLMHTPISIGTQSSALVHPREVFGPAIREGASSIILVHNHPSGDPTPSREDIRLTRQLVEAGKLLEVEMYDHIIVGSGTWTWVSMGKERLL